MSRTAIIPNWWRLALLVVALAVVALLLTRCTHGRAEYDRRIAALRAAGEPVTTADCAARYPPPPERDFRQLLRSVLPASSDPLANPYLAVGPAADQVRAFANREPFDSGLLEQVRLELASNAAPVELLLRTVRGDSSNSGEEQLLQRAHGEAAMVVFMACFPVRGFSPATVR